jgi:hypothetical protein
MITPSEHAHCVILPYLEKKGKYLRQCLKERKNRANLPGYAKAPPGFGSTPGIEFTFLDSLFYGIPHEPVKPLIIKGLFGPDYGFQGQFQLIFTGLTEIPVGNMKIIAPHYRLLDSMFTYITSKGLHK